MGFSPSLGRPPIVPRIPDIEAIRAMIHPFLSDAKIGKYLGEEWGNTWYASTPIL